MIPENFINLFKRRKTIIAEDSPSVDFSSTNVVIAYKNFSVFNNLSHIGLGTAANSNADYLNKFSINTTVIPVTTNVEIVDHLNNNPQTTHMIIFAPWLSSYDMEAMLVEFPNVKFVMLSHSNVGFLQADANGVTLIRQAIELTKKHRNFHVGGNSIKFVNWLNETFFVDEDDDSYAVYLPNLYEMSRDPSKLYKYWNDGTTLNIGMFGAVRSQKNNMTAAGAAMTIAKKLDTPVNFHMSVGREDGDASLILSAIRNLTADIPNFKVVEVSWMDNAEFKRLIGDMHLLLQPSYTESFNLVTADGISAGVPTVTSEAIDWSPISWRGHIDDAVEIAETGIRLLNNKEEFQHGVDSLENYNLEAYNAWESYLQ